MDSKILVGIIAVTIFGTLGVQGTMVQAGVFPIETIQVNGEFTTLTQNEPFGFSSAQCPSSHPFLIGGATNIGPILAPTHLTNPHFDTDTNTFSVEGGIGGEGGMQFMARALCANFNFPMQMGMVGGELLDINTLPLLVGAIGVNPIITGLIGITIAGVVGQVAWFVHKRKKSENS